MHIPVLYVLLFILTGCTMADTQGTKTGAVVNVKDYASKESFTSGIQEAINALRSGRAADPRGWIAPVHSAVGMDA